MSSRASRLLNGNIGEGRSFRTRTIRNDRGGIAVGDVRLNPRRLAMLARRGRKDTRGSHRRS